jgi:hypothetical protein
MFELDNEGLKESRNVKVEKFQFPWLFFGERMETKELTESDFTGT